MRQFTSVRTIDSSIIARGMFILILRLFKKSVIADSLAQYVNQGFDTAATLTFIEAWVTSLGYTLQLYFDFSGYTAMAIGAALFFNIRLPVNFNTPYHSLTICEFWKRWHITLGRFLGEYIYIPLGGNRMGSLITYRNIMITFIICGIWHGAGWTFILWGFLHWAATVVHRIWSRLGYSMNRILAWFPTFNYVNICWVFSGPVCSPTL